MGCDRVAAGPAHENAESLMTGKIVGGSKVSEQQLSSGLKQVAKVVKDQVKKFRLASAVDWEDVEQETHAELASKLGPDYGDQIEEAMAAGPNFKKSPVYQVLRGCIWRAWDSLRTHPRRKGRDKPVSLSAIGEPEDPSPGIEAVNLVIDLAETLDGLGAQEQQVWELMYKHYHVTDIARELGIRHQRVSKIRAAIIAKLRHRIIKE